MKKCFLSFVPIILFLLAVQIDAQGRKQVDYPLVPRVTAFEAFAKYKDGKAIILHAGGEAYNKRHILGAFNVERFGNIEKHGYEVVDKSLIKFPKKGIEIFTYCY